MGANAQREQLVAALYASAMGRMDWHVALAALAVYSSTRCITLDSYDLDEHTGQVIASNMAPHPAIEEYNRVFGQRNVLIETAYPGLEPGRAFTASSLVAMRDFERTELYNTVYRALGIKHAAGVLLEIDRNTIVQLSLIKPQDGGDFSPADLHKLRELGPHFLQAWAGYSHLQQLNASLETVTGLWDRFDHAVMVIDAHLRLRFANRAGEALLASGQYWVSRNGYLRARKPECHARLQQVVTAVDGKQQEVCNLAASSDKTAPGLMATLFRIDAGRLALVITDPLRSESDFRSGLQVRFGLTVMEAELVNDLIQGGSVKEFADDQGISYETARTHLKNAMSKNGWRRQGQMLVAVLKQLLPPGLFHPDRA